MKTKKRRLIILLVPVLLLVLGLAWILIPEAPPKNLAEPVYKGRSLSDWLSQYASQPALISSAPYIVVDETHVWVPTTTQPDPSAEQAIKEIGTNGLPTLLAMLHYEDPVRVRWADDLGWVFQWMDDTQRSRFLPPPPQAFIKHSDAAMGLYLLGPLAAPVLRQATNDPNPSVRETANDLLSKLP